MRGFLFFFFFDFAFLYFKKLKAIISHSCLLYYWWLCVPPRVGSFQTEGPDLIDSPYGSCSVSLIIFIIYLMTLSKGDHHCKRCSKCGSMQQLNSIPVLYWVPFLIIPYIFSLFFFFFLMMDELWTGVFRELSLVLPRSPPCMLIANLVPIIVFV